jgi:small-conductance mechanosensitive channel
MLETIYTDFTTKLLPKIAEGLVMTKDYFTDLFGRYVHFLIVRDAIVIGLLFIVVIICFMLWKHYSKKYREATEKNGNKNIYADGYIDTDGYTAGTVIPILVGIACLLGMFALSITLIKTIYIPEVVVYQQIKMFNQ